MHISGALADLGLESNAVHAYAALCEMGHGTPALIAKRSNLKRTTVYSVLARLEELGLVSREQRAGVLAYVASRPEAIVKLAEDRKRKADESLRAAKELTAALRTHQGRDAVIQPKVQIFEGSAAINAMLRSQDSIWRSSLMAGNCTWLGFQDDAFFKQYGDWVIEYWQKFAAAPDIKRERVFLFSNTTEVNSQMTIRLKKYIQGERIIRPLPEGIQFSSGMWIVGEYVITTKTRNRPHIAMVFRDHALATNLGAVFEHLWRSTAMVALGVYPLMQLLSDCL